jgi:phosphoglycolate phosphatase
MLFFKSMIRFRRRFDPEKIQLVIFDLDGTLIDSRLDLVHSVNAALRYISRPELPEDVIASYVGDGAPMLIRRALGEEADDLELARRGLEYFLSYYKEHKLDHTVVYDGIPEALKTIHNAGSRKLAVLTNKPVRPSVAIIEALNLAHFFGPIFGGNSFSTKKPDPEGARAILHDTGIAAENTLIVGDSAVDVVTARNAGLWSCGVTYGFAPHTLEKEPPDVRVDTAEEIGKIFS